MQGYTDQYATLTGKELEQEERKRTFFTNCMEYAINTDPCPHSNGLLEENFLPLWKPKFLHQHLPQMILYCYVFHNKYILPSVRFHPAPIRLVVETPFR